jgi:hypothetical protein
LASIAARTRVEIYPSGGIEADARNRDQEFREAHGSVCSDIGAQAKILGAPPQQARAVSTAA